MSQPTVTAIMLTADRQAQTDRAVASFLAQTYKQSHLLIYDTGKKPYRLECLASSRIVIIRDGPEMARPIGAMRNVANSIAVASDILIHMDSDDLSGPYRIQDQVQTLIDSGKECVGYRSVLFYRKVMSKDTVRGERYESGEAWAYHNIQPTYCIGASFCYWRKVWERQKFREDLPGPERGMGEDREWLRHVDSEGYPGISGEMVTVAMRGTPSLVCEIHGGNTMIYNPEDQDRGPTGWTRAPEWDAKLRTLMAMGDEYQKGNV